ncbi:DUF262 domain-containing HNH endonuclease family protein [Vibrio harveyi]|uniref:DUF262 domain-containing protein n=4 Tax=Vibrio harveyi group TaxID=717610 RepID=A0ABM5XTQ8_VIBHA|nr:DUF262 domain-containing protein [Vibrio harveyi]AMF96452.1 DUF262 domain-containing protein [Vibrio harveyi]MCR9770056.1 DUF262 domain-containing HNH endonuclease family protein [Vibrio harveyi]WCP80866.1 DUF262 domain-containing HNH endonuclease family protein [Vibrio harveyi]
MNLSTANDNFRTLVGSNVTYSIPPFQRDYSWSEENWEELWFDIMAMYSGEEDAESEHYMGYLVLQSVQGAKYKLVIDGQQRITTISIIILSALRHLRSLIEQGLDAENNAQREKVLREAYIGYIDPTTLKAKSKLTLNKHNDRFYQTFIATNSDRIPQRNLKSSEHLLRKSYEWYSNKLSSYFGNEADSGAKVTAFIDSLVDKLFFTIITVTNELNAFKVFETLNARGVKLSSTDLLKNYLFSVLSSDDPHDSVLLELEESWERITGLLSSESFPELLRIFWNSKHKLVRKKDLFKTIQKSIDNEEKAFKLVRDLEFNSEIYANLRDPNSEIWNPQEKDALGQLSMFGVKQPIAMLMSAYRKFYSSDRETFSKIVNSIAVISFRYNVICSLPPQDQEGLYSSVATRIENGELSSATLVIQALRDIYPQDTLFEGAFAAKQLRTTNSRNQKVVQYILKRLEEHIAGASIDLSTTKFNVEHVLPQKVSTGWSEFNETRHSQSVYRLANMVILEKSINQNIGNSDYSAKKAAFLESSVATTKALAEHYDSWSPDAIESRQKYLSKQAKSIWKINGL